MTLEMGRHDEDPSPEEIARVDRLIEHLKTRPFIASVDEGDDEDDEAETTITLIPKMGNRSESEGAEEASGDADRDSDEDPE